jgi:O-acetyl-ADP-ribose deacetylase (regulator of RNase III)
MNEEFKMITYIKGNIFESNAKTLVNPVNTDGVMGKGLAKEFKKLYPGMFIEYQRLCKEKKLVVGKLLLHKGMFKWILNFPTKTSWKKPSCIKYIESGLISFTKNYEKYGITSIAFPALGCGNGGLDWEKQVKPLMEKYLNNLPIEIYIYE